MAKNIFKEIIIILLLALAIILILGVLLYEYVPTNKIIPEKVSYTTPDDVKTELEEKESGVDDPLEITYHVDSTELTNYKKIQEYVPGKKNPFAAVSAGTDETDAEDGTSTTGNTTSTTGSSTTSSSDTTENTGYLPNKGTK